MSRFDEVVYQSGRGPDHEDDRRALWTAFNGEFDFRAAQVKVAHMKGTRVLGGHFHPDYRELFMLFSEHAVFRLIDPETRETRDFPMAPGDRLLIPARMPHAAIISGGGILIGCTEKAYVSPTENDVPFTIDPPIL